MSDDVYHPFTAILRMETSTKSAADAAKELIETLLSESGEWVVEVTNDLTGKGSVVVVSMNISAEAT